MISKKSRFIQRVKAKLVTELFIIDMGFISFYLGLKMKQDQIKYTI